MKRSLVKALAFSLILLSLTLSAIAQEDAEDCSDSPLLTRMQGCYISWCESNDYGEAEIQTGPEDEETGEPKIETVEGEITAVTYSCPGRLSPLQIIRNAENALKKNGFSVVYSGDSYFANKGTTLRKGGLLTQITSSEVAGDETDYTLTVVKSTEMAQEMSSGWAEEIGRTGRVAVYGIEFDTGRATIRGEAEPVLQEIITLLDSQPSLRLRVEGHTDNTGSAEANQKLSEQRAEAVVDWLTKNGVASGRLVPSGEGSSYPVADNRTEEGRAKNRRVELVRL